MCSLSNINLMRIASLTSSVKQILELLYFQVNGIQQHNIYREQGHKFLQSSQQLEDKCTPKLELLNCGVSASEMPRMSPYTSTMILSNLEVDTSCTDLDSVITRWEVKLVTNNNNLVSVRIKEFVDKKNYFVEIGSLYYGVYKVDLQLNVVFSNKILSANASCYFEMVRLPVQTLIGGGSKRSKFFKSSISFEVLTIVFPDVCESNEGIGRIPRLKVIYEWRCDSGDYFCNPFKTTEAFREISGPFTQSKEYNFSLKVQTVEKHSSSTVALSQQPEFQAIKMDSDSELELTIECVVNCGGSVFKSNPQEIIHLEAKLSTDLKNKNTSITYHWNYHVVGSGGKTEDVADIRETGTGNNVLVVKRNKLTENQTYIFTVSLGHSSYAELVVETCSLPTNPSCTIFPDSGTRGVTYFDINCSILKQKEHPLTLSLEFFDRYLNEDFGRYLGLSTTGILKRVVLTRDKLFVRSINIFGAYFETEIHLQLSPFPQNMTDSNLKSGSNLLGNYLYRIGMVTAYSDYLNSQEFSPNSTSLLLTKLQDEEAYIEDITGATLLLNALHIIFVRTSNKTQYLESKTVRTISKIMYHASKIFKDTVTNQIEASRYATTIRVLEIANCVIECSSALLGSSDTNSFDLLDKRIHSDLKASTFYIRESLNNACTTVAFKGLISFLQITLDSKYIWVILINDGLQLENTIPSSEMFQISPIETKICFKMLQEIQTQIIVFRKIPFWWESRHAEEISTEIIEMKQKHGLDFILLNETSEETVYIDLSVVDFEPLMISGSVKQPNPRDSPDVNDFVVAVHRIAPVVHSKSFVKFVGIEGNSTLRVIMLQDQRPDFDYININAMVLTNESSRLNLTMVESNNNLFLYIGILPGKDVKVGETINYTFELFTASCKVRRYKSWMMGSKCKVAHKTEKNQVSCACSMFTVTLGGLLVVPPHNVNPFSDIQLLISASDSPFAVILVLSFVILYAFLLLFTYRKDKKNKSKVNLIVLEDNDDRDTCGYLVGVFTGSRIIAGTTSKVEIMLLGEEGMSRSHILRSEHRATLQANSDDWFLLYTRHHLGSLTNILLRIDYSGSRPHWYCSRIFVCDLQNYDTDTFYVEKWFGINVQEIYLKMFKECATYKDINSISRIISENVEYSFKEYHLWLSLFIRHPRSLVSSSQRLAVAFCSLFITIGVSALVYSISLPEIEDLPLYSISEETFISGVIGGLVGSFTTFIMFYLFKVSYKLVPSPGDYHEHSEGAGMYHLERKISIPLEDPSWIQKIKKAIRYLKPCKVMPVQSYGHSLVGVKVNRKKVISAYILCFIVSVFTIHLTITCGRHFGKIKASLWVSSLAIGMIQTICVTLPIHAVIISLIFAVSKTRYFPLMSHIIKTNQTIHGSRRRMTYEEMSKHLTNWRALCISDGPVHAFSELELHRKQVKIKVLWTSAYIFECLLFLTIVSWLILKFNLNEFCIINTTVRKDLHIKESYFFSQYARFQSYGQFLDTLEKKVLPELYSRFWYNGASKTLETESFANAGWLANEHSRLIGPPRLRQIRVKNVDYCNTARLMIDNSSLCFVPLNADTEDKGKYSAGWVVDDWIDCQFDEDCWHFSDANQAKGALIRTPSGLICHGGGYVSLLRGSEEDAKLIIRHILDNKWIDSYTRILMLEFTTYNVNKGTYTSASFFAETTPFGTLVANHIVQSVKLSHLPLSGIVFLAHFLAFLLQVLVVMNIKGVGNFLKNLWHIQEIFILASYLLSAIYYSDTWIQKEKYREHIQTQGRDVYFHVQILTSEIEIMNDTIIGLFCLVAFRMLRIIRFNSDVRQYLKDLQTAIQAIVWIWVVLSLFIFVQWRLVMFLVVLPPGDSFKDVLVFQSDFKIVIYQYQETHGKLLAFLVSLVTQIGMFSYVCSLTHYYRRGQLLKRNPIAVSN